MVSAWSLTEYPSCEVLLTGKLQQFTVADRNPPRSEREPGGKSTKVESAITAAQAHLSYAAVTLDLTGRLRSRLRIPPAISYSLLFLPYFTATASNICSDRSPTVCSKSVTSL